MNVQKHSAGKEKTPKGAKDIYTMRKRKKRRKVLQQSIWLLLLAVTILVLYQRRDSWIPKLETMGMRHQNHRLGTDAETDGNLPISVFGDTDYQTGSVNGKLLLLSDAYLYIYETDGSQITARQHTYGSAMLQTAGDYALIYESGGTSFRLETVAKTRFEKKADDPIIFGRVSPNGQIALITSADTCSCKMLVFNQKGQKIYERHCVERISDLSFHNDDGGCFAVSSETGDGELKSVIHSYSFTEKTDLWTSQPLDMLAISVYNTSGEEVFVLGDTQCCYLGADGSLISCFTYPDTLDHGVFSGETAALVFSNNEKRTNSVVILNGSAAAPVLRIYDKAVMDIQLQPERETVLVQLRSQLESLSMTGERLGTVPVTDNSERILLIGDYLFLHCYDHIGRMDAPTFGTEKNSK